MREPVVFPDDDEPIEKADIHLTCEHDMGYGACGDCDDRWGHTLHAGDWCEHDTLFDARKCWREDLAEWYEHITKHENDGVSVMLGYPEREPLEDWLYAGTAKGDLEAVTEAVYHECLLLRVEIVEDALPGAVASHGHGSGVHNTSSDSVWVWVPEGHPLAGTYWADVRYLPNGDADHVNDPLTEAATQALSDEMDDLDSFYESALARALSTGSVIERPDGLLVTEGA